MEAIWTIAAPIVTAVGLLLPIIYAAVKVTDRVRQWRVRRRLKRQAGTRLFPSDVVREATRWYVEPDCSSVDETHEAELRHAIVVKQPLFRTIDAFVAGPDQRRHLFVLADSGMGKTSFVLNYCVGKVRVRTEPTPAYAAIPLSDPQADDELRTLEHPENTILFLDAFDEDAKAIADFQARMSDLMALSRRFKKVVVTCRTQFFPRDAEIPVRTGVLRVGPRRAGEGQEYEFWKLYLCGLSDNQVGKFLGRRYPWWRLRGRLKARRLADKMPLLSARPMLLAHIPDVLSSLVEIRFAYELYEQMVGAWCRRESGWIETSALRSVSEYLAVDLFVNRLVRGGEHIPFNELRALGIARGFPFDQWKLSSRSLLNRDASGNYKFAHRSIMEYLVVCLAATGSTAPLKPPWTDQMVAFWGEMIFKRLDDQWRQFKHSPTRRALGGDFDAPGSVTRFGESTFPGIAHFSKLAMWVVHNHGQPSSGATPHRGEEDAHAVALLLNLGSGMTLRTEVRGEATVEFGLIDHNNKNVRAFVFDALQSEGMSTIIGPGDGARAYTVGVRPI